MIAGKKMSLLKNGLIDVTKCQKKVFIADVLSFIIISTKYKEV